VHADLWRQQATGKGDARVTVLQASAPETVVITADSGKVDSVTLSVEKKTWFVQALLAALSGLLLAVAGLTITLTAGRPPASWESLAPGTELRRSRRRHSRSMGRSGRTTGESDSATPEPDSATPESDSATPESGSPTGGSGADGGGSSRSDKSSGRAYQPRRAAAKGGGTSR
jgi:hypothetical protein